MSNTITFTLGEETLPKIESSKYYANSLFREQYDKSFDWIEAYLDKVDKAKKDKDELRELNNVLAYIGERGSGKTSCMLSVARMLSEDTDTWKEHHVPIKCSKNFFVLNPHIDPSFFDKKNDILSLIIARLFSTFEKELNKRRNDEDRDDCSRKNKLLEYFKKVNDNIDLLLSKEKDVELDSLQRINDLAGAVNLRDNIEELVKKYLDFFKSDILVIPVDDVDLHTSEAYQMVEQIRKYFVLPNVIVLFAVKLDQLELVIKKQYVSEFNDLLRLSGRDALDVGVLDEMVDRYLGKFIPLEQRIYLTEVEKLYNLELEIIEGGGNTPDKFGSVREAVPSLIYKKTRYLFYNSTVSTSLIVPRNLRELRMLIALLWRMSPHGAGNSSETQYNKAEFKKYFFETWMAGNLSPQDHAILKNLLACDEAAIFNKMVIMVLKERFLDKLVNVEVDRLRWILSDLNSTYNVSLGDVMAVVRYLERLIHKRTDLKLMFALRTLYSIKFYDYYVDYLENYDDDPKNPEIKEKAIDPQNHEICRSGLLPKVSNLEKLAGGNFINSDHALANLLPPKDRKHEMEQRIINIKEINRHAPLWLREFFALTTSRRIDRSDKGPNANFRRLPQAYYLKEFGREEERGGLAVFDVASIFFNLLNIKRCYKRFHANLYSSALADNNSILNKLFTAAPDRYHANGAGVNLGKNLLSWSTTRNMEVLDDLLDKLVDYEHERAGREAMAKFFDTIAGYNIETYDIENEKPTKINYGFAAIIATVLNAITDADFNRWFFGDEPALAPKIAVKSEIAHATAPAKGFVFNPVLFVESLKFDNEKTITAGDIKYKLGQRKFGQLHTIEPYRTKIEQLFEERRRYHRDAVASIAKELSAFINSIANGQPASND